MKTLTLILFAFLLEMPRVCTVASAQPTEFATFGGGCFWCMEPAFDKLNGVIRTTSGYAGGKEADPTYEEVSSGTTGHAEVVQVEFDPRKVTYEKLLEVYWVNSDPTTADRQFCDTGKQYRPVIFYHNNEQKELAEESRKKVGENPAVKGRIMTEIVPLTRFYAAEEYHQDFYKKNPSRYKSYREGCERDKRLEELWGESGKE
jgi:peptide-methionine (S)-S-oxide reductase